MHDKRLAGRELDDRTTTRRRRGRLPTLAVALLAAAAAAIPAFARPYVYVTNQHEHTVSVIDAATYAVTASIAVGAQPLGVAVAPDGSRVYVTSWIGEAVSVIDATTNTVLASIAVGDAPAGVAVAPDGSRVYVTNVGDDTVSVIDAAAHAVTDTIEVGDSPFRLAVSPDGSRVYVANLADDTVSVIDAAANAVAATLAVGDKPRDVAVAPDGTQIYVTIGGADAVYVIDAATNVIHAIDVGDNPHGVAVAPDGSRVYVTDFWGDAVSVIDAATSTVTATIDVGQRPGDVAVAPDGSRVYVTNLNDDTVSVIDAAAYRVTATLAVADTPRDVAVGPDLVRLLLPHFEVDHNDPQGATTFFSVRNETDGLAPIAVRYYEADQPVTPQRIDQLTLPPRRMQPWDLRTLGLHQDAAGFARGYAVIESRRSGARIDGDFFRLDRAGNFASGERLVDLDTGLCRKFSVRYFNGGPFDGGAIFYLWVRPGAADAPEGPIATCTVYEENGAMIVPPTPLTLESSGPAFAVRASDFPLALPTFGVIELEFVDSVGHVSVVMTANDRYSVGLEASCEEGG